MTKYSPLSRGEIWVDSAGCKWYIYGTQDYYRSSTRYLAKCIDGFALGKMREYFYSGESIQGWNIVPSLIKQVDN